MRHSDPNASFLLNNMVNTGRSKQVWHGQGTRVILRQAWVGDRQTISRELGREKEPGTRAGIRTQEIKQEYKENAL